MSLRTVRRKVPVTPVSSAVMQTSPSAVIGRYASVRYGR